MRWIVDMIAVCLGAMAPAFAQTHTLFVVNNTAYTLDNTSIYEKAKPLVDCGAWVAVYLVEDGGRARGGGGSSGGGW